MDNLEAISSEAGQIPRRYEDKLLQLQGRILHTESKVQEHITTDKKHKYKTYE